jgi:MFS family permease
VLHGFADGARATAATPSISASFAALGAHRLAFGISTLLTLLLFRYAFTDSGILRAGLPGIGEAVVAAAAGLGLAALVAPWLVHHWGRPRTVRVALLAAAVTQVALAVLLSLWAVLVAAFVLGLTGQIVKLCTDAAVQGEARDDVLGRVFALYDVVFNVGYVIAVAAAAFLSPPDGRAPWLLAAAAGLYLLGWLVHDQQLRRRSPLPRPAVPPPPAPA